MAYVPKDMSGSLFKNDRKERPTHPDYKGSAILNGIDYWVSAWVKESQNGKKFLSMAFNPKQEQAAYQRPTTQAPGPASDLDPAWNDENDDLPF